MIEPSTTRFKNCATCKKEIGFGTKYYQCSVSTCQRRNTDFAFCTHECWDSHVPTFRHKDAWALEVTSPSLVQFQAHAKALQSEEVERQMASEKKSEPLIPSGDLSTDDILVVASKLKGYVRAKSGMSTSADTMEVLSDKLRLMCDQAIIRAQQAGRKTLMGRDF